MRGVIRDSADTEYCVPTLTFTHSVIRTLFTGYPYIATQSLTTPHYTALHYTTPHYTTLDLYPLLFVHQSSAPLAVQ